MPDQEQRVFVVVPTYNEADNIETLCERLCKVEQVRRVLVVDDSSPDGTAEKAQALSARLPVEVLRRSRKDGRGGAVLDGLARGLKDPQFTHFIEMDADLSHDPGAIAAFLEKARDCDVVIGSRYVPGGRISNWPLSRRIFSRMANWLARRVLGVPVKDYTTGYRCYSRRSLEALNRTQIEAKGFIALSAMLYQLYLKGFSVTEVPIHFVNRARGASNFSLAEIADAFTYVFRLRARRRLLMESGGAWAEEMR